MKGGACGGNYGSDGVVPSLPSVGTVVYSFSGVESGRGGVGEQGRKRRQIEGDGGWLRGEMEVDSGI